MTAFALCDHCGHARSLHLSAARCRADRGDCTCEAFRREPEQHHSGRIDVPDGIAR